MKYIQYDVLRNTWQSGGSLNRVQRIKIRNSMDDIIKNSFQSSLDAFIEVEGKLGMYCCIDCSHDLLTYIVDELNIKFEEGLC